ncbi:hypothetical protein NLG97_g6418 [Lecanicillium saksenae]|uniref:Uncharacterized protein n=1 Tax=Lecanicillium saksenae TaxID=468837 RepID=A0ACC1QR03_9HYPO|nr:hypothetical protein NLG97_g6418 [Lecanicillium saksenae]
MPSSASRRLHDGETRANAAATMKLWDGHTRTAVGWSGLHREPELWATKGNCLVYLYGKGQCNAGASFRVHFSALLENRCYAFIAKYIDKQGRNFDMPKTDADWSRLRPKRTVSLYVPAAPGSTRAETARQHLSIRNFLAWISGLPLVGAHLGGEIVTLFRNMVTYRPPDADSTKDLLAYLDVARYLDIVAQPHHALAILYVAEFIRDQDLYTRAFVHCVGMGECVFRSTEYTKISLLSRKLIRTANRDLKSKLNSAIEDLGSFLDEELSETRLGLPHGVRAHLERFRTTLFTFYTAKFGYYPPRDFDPKVVQTMLDDFEALYDLLVDDGAGTPGMLGGNNGGGLCILQIIRTFDSWNSFESRRHPLPLLPSASEVRRSRRLPWLGRGEKQKPANKLVAHTALIKASNWRESSFKNDLVRMYRDFEGKSLDPSTNKVDKAGNVSITDARKVRWILIYAMCQVLRSISQRAPQVEGERAPYFLTASVAELPPWSTALDTTMELPTPNNALPTMPQSADEPWQPRFAAGVEIKPDIDYFALTHNTERPTPTRLGRRQSMPVVQDAGSPPMTLSPSNSVSGNTLLRRSTIRNSIRRRLRPGTANSTNFPMLPLAKSVYHEIVVHGYGNGTNEVKLARRNTVGCDNTPTGNWSSEIKITPNDPRLPNITSPAMIPESTSTQSRSGSNRSSNASSIGTVDSQVTSGPASPVTISTPEFEQNAVEPVIVRNSSHKSLTQRYPMKSVLETISRSSSKRRGSLASTIGGPKELPPLAQQSPFPGSLSRGPSFRKSILPDGWMLTGRTTVEHDIDEEDEIVTLQSEADEWIAMQAFLDNDGLGDQSGHSAITPGWEQYNDLGGLTEVR